MTWDEKCEKCGASSNWSELVYSDPNHPKGECASNINNGEYGVTIDAWPDSIDLWCNECGVEERVYIKFTHDQIKELIVALTEAVEVSKSMTDE